MKKIDDMLNVKDAATYLTCTTSTLYALVRLGKIKAIKISQRNIRLLQSDLDAYLRMVRNKI